LQPNKKDQRPTASDSTSHIKTDTFAIIGSDACLLCEPSFTYFTFLTFFSRRTPAIHRTQTRLLLLSLLLCHASCIADRYTEYHRLVYEPHPSLVSHPALLLNPFLLPSSHCILSPPRPLHQLQPCLQPPLEPLTSPTTVT